MFVRSLVNDAQKVRAKKSLDEALSGFRDQHAFFDLEQTDSQQTLPVNGQMTPIESIRPTSNSIGNEHQRRVPQHSTRRSVSFADRVNVMNDDDEQEIQTEGQMVDSSSLLMNPSLEYSTHPDQYQQQRAIENDFYNYSSPIVAAQPSMPLVQPPPQHRSTLPSKYRLPEAKEILVNKMDSNLRMLIIKELSKNGYTEQPLSRMSQSFIFSLVERFDVLPLGSAYSGESGSRLRHRPRSSAQNDATPEWIELARLIGIDDSEIDHWSSQNLQYPAGRVISAWCNYAVPPPTVAELYSVLSSKELNRPDLARYIETMYIIE